MWWRGVFVLRVCFTGLNVQLAGKSLVQSVCQQRSDGRGQDVGPSHTQVGVHTEDVLSDSVSPNHYCSWSVCVCVETVSWFMVLVAPWIPQRCAQVERQFALHAAIHGNCTRFRQDPSELEIGYNLYMCQDKCVMNHWPETIVCSLRQLQTRLGPRAGPGVQVQWAEQLNQWTNQPKVHSCQTRNHCLLLFFLSCSYITFILNGFCLRRSHITCPYTEGYSRGLTWIWECSFWPGRKYYWLFQSFMSTAASWSQTLSKAYCYLINICAWFSGQILVLSADSRLPFSRRCSPEIKHMLVWK